MDFRTTNPKKRVVIIYLVHGRRRDEEETRKKKHEEEELYNFATIATAFILKTIRQQGINEEDTSVRKFLHRDTEMYRMDVEVMVTFSDFSKMEQICSVLLEKLDKSVCVGMPRFYHSPECMSQIRLRACVSAVENAQQKASKLSQLLGQSLGPPMLVREEETQERTHEEEEDEEGGGRDREQDSLPLPNFPHKPTVTASSQVSVFFSFRDGNRKNL
ncbi:interleukin-1 receptor-associated kinase 1-binding protein 1 homolog [Cololabis saira]|uniref:interleukin-1 receptor-associated kinase 1-binding protein 1 homolog n=1 Tax=Cololabis saira TaxID=129043 RepID=UPI002AD36FD1|nr:interleukin-1 receptor-associated kinase 1-binding protein 1 homolog [Cololabis saira]